MSLISAFLNQNITSVLSVSIDGRNNKTTTVVYTNVPCRWVNSIKRVLDNNNEVQQSTIEVWINPSYTILYDYQIVKDSTTYRILRIENRYDLAGNLDHIKLFLV